MAIQASPDNALDTPLPAQGNHHGISRLPELDTDKPAKKKFKPYPIGYFHIDIAEGRTEEGKLYLFVAIDRTSKFAFVKLVAKAGKAAAVAFVRELIKAAR